MKIETPKTEQPCTLHGIKQRFDVATYTIQEGEGMGYCHWSEGLNMIITKGDDPRILYDIFEGKQVGTLFLKKGQEIRNK